MAKAAPLMAFLLVTASAAFASDVMDPTRPPAQFGVSKEQDKGTEAHTGPVLQSVLISSGRKVAIISGTTVKVGDKYNEARVVKIAETEVVLRAGKDLQTLKLFPAIDKKISSRRAEHPSIERTQ